MNGILSGRSVGRDQLLTGAADPACPRMRAPGVQADAVGRHTHRARRPRRAHSLDDLCVPLWTRCRRLGRCCYGLRVVIWLVACMESVKAIPFALYVRDTETLVGAEQLLPHVTVMLTLLATAGVWVSCVALDVVAQRGAGLTGRSAAACATVCSIEAGWLDSQYWPPFGVINDAVGAIASASRNTDKRSAVTEPMMRTARHDGELD